MTAAPKSQLRTRELHRHMLMSVSQVAFCRALRALAMAVAVTTILPLINTFGIFPVYTAIAGIAWLAYGYVPRHLVSYRGSQ